MFSINGFVSILVYSNMSGVFRGGYSDIPVGFEAISNSLIDLSKAIFASYTGFRNLKSLENSSLRESSPD